MIRNKKGSIFVEPFLSTLDFHSLSYKVEQAF